MITNKRVWVEYINHVEGWSYSEMLSWPDFCNLGMEYGIEITFCCFEDDPRLHVGEE